MMAVRWRPARSLTTFKTQINAAHPDRPTASDGMLASAAHTSVNPSSDHEPRIIHGENVVCAIDVTKDTWTQATVDALVASRDSRIKYLIWQRRFCAGVDGWGSPRWVWVPYTGSNPHDKHFHLSVNAGNCDDTRPWSIGQLEDDMAASDVKAINENTNIRTGILDKNSADRTAMILKAVAADPNNPLSEADIQKLAEMTRATTLAAVREALAELEELNTDAAEAALRRVFGDAAVA
jgi:hypothetical protein